MSIPTAFPRSRPALGALALATCSLGLALVPSAPASAAGVVVTPSGNALSIATTGDVSVEFGCFSSKVAVNGTVVSPNIACNLLDHVVVTGDSGAQVVRADELDFGAFTGHPYLTANMNDGADTVFGTAQADNVALGPGDDGFYENVGSVANVAVSLGTGSNTWELDGQDLADTITFTSTGSTVAAHVVNSQGTRDLSASSVHLLYSNGNGGNDEIDASGVTAASTVTSTILYSGSGSANHLIGSVTSSAMDTYGGSATMDGGPAQDYFYSYSTADVIHGNGGEDWVYDDCCGRTGGRTAENAGGHLHFSVDLHGNDAVARIRPDARYGTGHATMATSLNRTGLTEWGPDTIDMQAHHSYVGVIDTAALFDVVLPAGANQVYVSGDAAKNDLLDVTVPTGTWVVSGSPALYLTIDPDDPSLPTMQSFQVGAYKVHGPWTDKDRGFAHRVNRDLLLAFPTDAARDAIRNQLHAGTTTRAAVVKGLVGSDAYRGLDVDRVFRRFLKRQADSSGRSYWISAIRNGKSLRKFRAQLFGSNEYFTKAGANTTSFVRAAYRDVLGRFPDRSGEAYWVHKIDTGTERGAVANAFLASSESKRSIVKDQFMRFLDRYPSASEETTWMSKLDTSASGEQDLVAFLASSTAYYDRS